MPTLNWIGKDKVVNHHLDVPFRVLEEQYTYGDNADGNMIIHGDNLDALKALLPRFEGRVKCIYIDPPYNTGNEGWVYNDNVNDPKIRKWLGEVVGREGEDLSRHDKWLCMMYPRLKLLQKLLAEDGVIFISIYTDEAAVNGLEEKVIFAVADLENVKWWHRNIERQGFCLNGFINHYPDFIVMTKKGNIVVIETKGDDRDNSDSRAKLALGKKWEVLAGARYSYFMVFDEKDTGLDGAMTVADFIGTMKRL